MNVNYPLSSVCGFWTQKQNLLAALPDRPRPQHAEWPSTSTFGMLCISLLSYKVHHLSLSICGARLLLSLSNWDAPPDEATVQLNMRWGRVLLYPVPSGSFYFHNPHNCMPWFSRSSYAFSLLSLHQYDGAWLSYFIQSLFFDFFVPNRIWVQKFVLFIERFKPTRQSVALPGAFTCTNLNEAGFPVIL